MLTLYQAKNGLKVEGLSGSSVPEDDLTLVKTNLNYLTERVDAVENEINNDIVKHSDFGDSEVQYPTKNYISVNYINKDEYREQMKTVATTTQVGVINDKVDECQTIINEAVSDISTIDLSRIMLCRLLSTSFSSGHSMGKTRCCSPSGKNLVLAEDSPGSSPIY